MLVSFLMYIYITTTGVEHSAVLKHSRPGTRLELRVKENKHKLQFWRVGYLYWMQAYSVDSWPHTWPESTGRITSV